MSTDEQREIPDAAADQVGTTAADLRPDLATDPEEERDRTSDEGGRHSASPEVAVADNAGQTPGAEQGNPDIGQEGGTVSEPG